MKRLAVFLFGLFISIFVFTGLAKAEEKLAYIDLSRTFSEYKKTKDYDKQLTDKENIYITERDKKLKEFNELKDKFALLNDKQREAKQSELENKAKTVKDFVTQKEDVLGKEQKEKMEEILKDIQDAVKEYSVKSKITVVFNDRVLVYQTKSMDITDEVIKILNNKSK